MNLFRELWGAMTFKSKEQQYVNRVKTNLKELEANHIKLLHQKSVLEGQVAENHRDIDVNNAKIASLRKHIPSMEAVVEKIQTEKSAGKQQNLLQD